MLPLIYLFYRIVAGTTLSMRTLSNLPRIPAGCNEFLLKGKLVEMLKKKEVSEEGLTSIAHILWAFYVQNKQHPLLEIILDAIDSVPLRSIIKPEDVPKVCINFVSVFGARHGARPKATLFVAEDFSSFLEDLCEEYVELEWSPIFAMLTCDQLEDSAKSNNIIREILKRQDSALMSL